MNQNTEAPKPLSSDALIKRLNRVLQKSNNLKLVVTRVAQRETLGRYHIVQLSDNTPWATFVDLFKFAQTYGGVLKPNEVLDDTAETARRDRIKSDRKGKAAVASA